MKYQSAFEIIGPIMVGPSSSHTAGAVRIGNIAQQLLNEDPVQVTFTLMGSFAETYEGHGTDLALLAGVLGLSTKDEGIPNAKEIAAQRHLAYTFTKKNLGDFHPNTVLVELQGKTRNVKLLGSSIGGGKVEIQELDDFPLKFSGEKPTLFFNHTDQKGIIAAISCALQRHGYNIARLALERYKKNGPAIAICEIDDIVEPELVSLLEKEIPNMDEIRMVQTE